MPNLLFAVSKNPRKISTLIAAGGDISVAPPWAFVVKQNKNYTWGLNNFGQLGINSTLEKLTPTSVSGAAKTFVNISAAQEVSVGLTNYGRVWTWGAGTLGVLGTNSIVSRSTPVSVCGAIKTFCSISAKRQKVMALDQYGKIWSWGANTAGQLGDNSTTNRSTPVSVCGAIKTFCKIAAGAISSYAIDKYGRVWSWGNNTNGILGTNQGIVSYRTPTSVCGAVKTFCEISAGLLHVLAIDKNGRAWAWGNGASGQLGNNIAGAYCTPVCVCGAVKTFCKVSAGQLYSIALDQYNKIWVWGNGSNGRIGNNSESSVLTPVAISGANKTFTAIAAQVHSLPFSLAVSNKNEIWAWGDNTFGQLGQGFMQVTPLSIKGSAKTFCKINAFNISTIVLTNQQTIWGWGVNTNGQLGDNSTTDRCTRVQISGANKTFCEINMGAFHAVGIDKNGRVWCWGNNQSGNLGNNEIQPKSTPVSVCGAVKTFCKISAGNYFTIGIDKNGRLWSWGNNANGILGNNSLVAVCTPVSVCGAVKTFCEISLGNAQSFAIDKYGRIWSWGIATAGVLGNNSLSNQSTPVSVCGAVKTFCKISTQGVFALAIEKNGRLWSWGINNVGQLGNRSNVSALTPVSVCGAVKTFCHVAAGNTHAAAIDKNGTVWTWGENLFGQLGDKTTANKSTPISVLGAVKTFCQISALDGSTVAIDKNGTVWTWGKNAFGQLGMGITQLTPVKVSYL